MNEIMQNTRRFAYVFALIFSLATQQATATFQLVPEPPRLNAESYIMLDFHSGQVLAQHDIEKRIDPASLTKMMTAYVVFYELENGTIKPEDMATVSLHAYTLPKTTGSSKMFLEHKQKVSVQDLLQGLVIQSGNDAAIVLAEHIAGSEESFVSLMNEHARNLRMNNTHFANSHGLTAENHYTTAQDLSLLATALIRDFPQYYYLHAVREFRFNNITQYNRNRLLNRDRSVDGIKTGHTDAAGYCLVASADRNNMRLITVVTGTRSERAREDESLKLFRYGYRFFTTHLIYESNTELSKRRIWYGDKEELSVGVARPVYVTVPRGQYDNIKVSLAVNDELEAPLNQGQLVGEVKISLNEQILRTEPVIALENIPEGDTWSQLGDWIIQLFD